MVRRWWQDNIKLTVFFPVVRISLRSITLGKERGIIEFSGSFEDDLLDDHRVAIKLHYQFSVQGHEHIKQIRKFVERPNPVERLLGVTYQEKVANTRQDLIDQAETDIEHHVEALTVFDWLQST